MKERWVITTEVYRNKDTKLIERIYEFGSNYSKIKEGEEFLTITANTKMTLIRACAVYLRLSKMGLFSMIYTED